MTRGMIVVSSPKQLPRKKIGDVLRLWYSERAAEVFDSILHGVYPAFSRRGCPKPSVSVRQMKRRWGSLSKKQRMTLNLKLIQAPGVVCIEYVIVHELCHLVHHDHGPHFLRLLRHVLPDWEERKARLEACMLS